MSHNWLKQVWYGTIIRLPWIAKRWWIRRWSDECFYCGEWLVLKTFTIDHVVPRSRGGSNKLSNLVACCKYCNKLKSDQLMTPTLLSQMLENKRRRGDNLWALQV